MNESPILTLKEVAHLLRCSTSTMYRMLQRGTAPPGVFRIGSDWRWNGDVLEAWRLGLGQVRKP